LKTYAYNGLDGMTVYKKPHGVYLAFWRVARFAD